MSEGEYVAPGDDERVNYDRAIENFVPIQMLKDWLNKANKILKAHNKPFIAPSDQESEDITSSLTLALAELSDSNDC